MLLSTLKNKVRDQREDALRSRNGIYAMQLLLSETKAMTGNGEDAFQDLYQLRGEIDQQSDECGESAQLPPSKWWSWRITSIIVNTAIRQRLWRLALAELRGLLDSVRAWQKRTSTSESSSSSKETSGNFRRVEVVILCRLSRILLQVRKNTTIMHFISSQTSSPNNEHENNISPYRLEQWTPVSCTTRKQRILSRS